jgi:putative membrane protein
MRLILHWLLSALSLIIVAHIVPGFEVRDFKAALIAALVIGLVNSTLGLLLKVLTFPFIVLTLGLFWFVINAFMLLFASHFVSGFNVTGFAPAFVGAIVLSVVNMILRWLFEPRREEVFKDR